MDRAVEKVEETAPFLKDCRLIFLLGKLIIDVGKLDGLGVVIGRNAADTVREHPLKGNRLLRCAGCAVITSGSLYDGLNLLLFLFRQVCGQLYRFLLPAALFQLCKQSHLPPVLRHTAESERHNSCWSGKAEFSDG